MDARTRKRLETAGFAIGTAAVFLGMSSEESALVEMRLALSGELRTRSSTKAM